MHEQMVIYSGEKARQPNELGLRGNEGAKLHQMFLCIRKPLQPKFYPGISEKLELLYSKCILARNTVGFLCLSLSKNPFFVNLNFLAVDYNA